MPVLNLLGWEVFNTRIVWPGFTFDGGRVDFALCDPPGEPRCFIEVLYQGALSSPDTTRQGKKANNAREKLMKCAFDSGAHLLVLTDGLTWGFYLPAQVGTDEERQVFMLGLLDLSEHDQIKAAEVLTQYLLKQDVVSGAAQSKAQQEYRDRKRRARALRGVPQAWNRLVSTGEELLIDLLAEECEASTGVRPERSDVQSFLKSLAYPGDTSGSNDRLPGRGQSPPVKGRTVRKPSRFTLFGEEYVCATMKDVLIEALTELAQSDPSFLSRCARNDGFAGRRRRFIGRTANELYPGRPDFHDCTGKLPGGWLVATNNGTADKIKLLKSACEVANIRFGHDLKVQPYVG